MCRLWACVILILLWGASALGEEPAVQIAAWDALENPHQQITLGREEPILLPDTLRGRTSQGEWAVVAVEWTATLEEEGVFTYSPSLPYGYEALGAPPQISVTVVEPLVKEGTVDEKGFTYRLKNGTLTLEAGQKASGLLVIPATAAYPDGRTYPVSKIAQRAFAGSGITRLQIPKGVRALGRSAFEGCKGLAEATLAGGITEMGEDVLADCTALQRVTLEQGSALIGPQAFRGCTALVEAHIPDTVTAMGPGAFEGCISLVSAPISKGLRTLPKRTFAGCRSLRRADLPQGITGIGAGAFENCTGLETVTIRGRVTAIGHGAFRGCSQNLRFIVHHPDTKGVLEAWGIRPEQIALQ